VEVWLKSLGLFVDYENTEIYFFNQLGDKRIAHDWTYTEHDYWPGGIPEPELPDETQQKLDEIKAWCEQDRAEKHPPAMKKLEEQRKKFQEEEQKAEEEKKKQLTEKYGKKKN